MSVPPKSIQPFNINKNIAYLEQWDPFKVVSSVISHTPVDFLLFNFSSRIIIYVPYYIRFNICATTRQKQDATQGQWVWTQSFLSPKLVAIPKLKNSVWPTIYHL